MRRMLSGVRVALRVEDDLALRPQGLDVWIYAGQIADLVLEPAVERPVGLGVSLSPDAGIVVFHFGDADHQRTVRRLLIVPALADDPEGPVELPCLLAARAGHL